MLLGRDEMGKGCGLGATVYAGLAFWRRAESYRSTLLPSQAFHLLESEQLIVSGSLACQWVWQQSSMGSISTSSSPPTLRSDVSALPGQTVPSRRPQDEIDRTNARQTSRSTALVCIS